MDKDIAVVSVQHNETIVLAFIEELQSSRVPRSLSRINLLSLSSMTKGFFGVSALFVEI
jgi:hypothetical protein